MNDQRVTLSLDSIREKTPDIAEKIECTIKWFLSRSWSDNIHFIVLYGSVSQGYARVNSDIDIVIGITGDTEYLTAIGKEIILKRPYEDLDLRIFEHLPIYIQKDIFKGLILYCRDIVDYYDLAYETLKKYMVFKPYLDDYIGAAPLS